MKRRFDSALRDPRLSPHCVAAEVSALAPRRAVAGNSPDIMFLADPRHSIQLDRKRSRATLR